MGVNLGFDRVPAAPERRPQGNRSDSDATKTGAEPPVAAIVRMRNDGSPHALRTYIDAVKHLSIYRIK